jgi:glutathione S-transferase
MQQGRHWLIGAPVSYYTAKVRAYLRYKQIPHFEVQATREVYRDVIVPRTGVRFIPVLITADDVAVQDSAAIIDHLEARYAGPNIVPQDPVARVIAALLETYADEWLVLPAMHYRWNVPENRAYAMEEFGRLSLPAATLEEQRAAGEKLAGPFAGALPALGVSASTVGAIEASYAALLAELNAHFAQHAFLLGSVPSRGDFALFGPLYAHLYRDPASGRMMRERAPRVAEWVLRMRDPELGATNAEHVCAPTLEPVLARMFREFGPVLQSTWAKLAEARLDADGFLPRAIGRHSFRLQDATGERAIYPFNAYRFQSAQDAYRQLTQPERARADESLERVGGLALFSAEPTRRLVRVDNRLKFAE